MFEKIIIKQAIEMIETQDLRGWSDFHDDVILLILKEKLNESQ